MGPPLAAPYVHFLAVVRRLLAADASKDARSSMRCAYACLVVCVIKPLPRAQQQLSWSSHRRR
eukprot:4125952-Alexandrium_andersonii.AAC.1